MATIIGTQGDDELAMLASGDVLLGRTGNDVLLATFAMGLLQAGAGDDRLVAQGTGRHFLLGDTGNDVFELGDSSNNVVIGGAGDDSFAVTGGTGNRLLGGDGVDAFSLFQAGDSVLWSGSQGGSFRLEECRDIRIHGSAESDSFYFVSDNPGIVIDAGAGKDYFDSFPEFSGPASSVLRGGAGDDEFSIANVGDSVFHGDSGNDLFRIGVAGNSTFNGGTGDDEIIVSRLSESSTLSGGWGNDILSAFEAVSCTLDGGAGNDVISMSGRPGFTGGHRVYGGAGDDQISSSADSGQFYGGTGNDRITLSFVFDATVDGGPGDDVLEVHDNQLGGNTLAGGQGSDRLSFDFWARDNVITDFDRVGPIQDRLDLSQIFEAVGRPDDSLARLVQDGYLYADASASVLGGAAADTVVRFDPDGTAGEASASTTVTLQDVTLATSGADADNWLV